MGTTAIDGEEDRDAETMSGLGKARSRAAAQADKDASHASKCDGVEPPAGPAPKKGRGRPPKEPSAPNAMDVLFAKGAAAQAQTNPGNLLFYQLCEEHYDAWAKLSDGDPRRRSTCEEIVASILSKGGVFRTKTGGVLPRKNAVEKARDRMRQIGKPKIRPQGFGEHDVVFARGAAIHIYPGNAKWRVLVEGRVASYWRDAVYGSNTREGWRAGTGRRTKKGKFAKGNCNQKARPAYQREIVDELVQIVHGRGGKFRHEGGSEASSEQVLARTYQTFKDLKKDHLSGKRTFAPWAGVKQEERGDEACARNQSAAIGKADAADVQVKQEDGMGRVNAGPEAFRNRSHGFTSVKTAVSSERELLAWQRKNRKKPAKRRTARRPDRHLESDEEDGGSLQSDMLDSDDDSDSSDDGDESVDIEWDDTAPQRANKREQDAAREERLRQRRSGVAKSPPPAKKRRRRRRSTAEEEEDTSPPADPAHSLSEYELYRLEKIQRNQAKLAELGLLNGKERKAARV